MSVNPQSGLQGRYQIQKVLVQGRFGAVYRAWDLALNRACLLKENFNQSPEAQDEFKREVKRLAKLSHVNLATVTNYFELPGQGQYLIMDVMEGQDLQSLIEQQGAVSEKVALEWISQVADALIYLHSQPSPIIHGAIKPANIWQSPDGRVVLACFGSLGLKISDHTTDIVRPLTAGYSPPEQYGPEIDVRADIYALGATLYTLLSGNLPPESTRRLAGDEMAAVDQLNSQLSSAAKATRLRTELIERAMSLRPRERYQRVIEFKAALKALRASLSSRRERKSDLLYSMMGFALLLLLFGSVLWMFNNEREAHQQAMGTMYAQSTIIAHTHASQITATVKAQQVSRQQTATMQAATTLQAEQTATMQAATTLQAEQTPTASVENSSSATATTTPSAVSTISPTVETTSTAQLASGLTETPTKVANNATAITQFTTPSALATGVPSIATSTPLTSSESAINREAEGTLVDRMTESAQNARKDSPFYNTTWVTYYGRPNIAVMGILGAYNVNELIPLLRKQTLAYDQANGPELDVMPALHLVYGMATKLPGEDNDHLAFLSDEVVMAYIEAAQKENMAVILDIQIGALTPLEAIQRGLPFLEYDNVHLAIDPEFAMKEPNQTRPGNPIGFVTAQEVNQVQRAMQEQINRKQIQGPRILLLHQFLESMIVNKDKLQRFRQINLTITIDGWGPPVGKIDKYNGFVQQNTFFTGFKLFYDWDNPLLSEREALGIDPYQEFRMDITPNLIIYQ